MSFDGKQRKRFYGKTRQEVAAQLTAALRDRDQGLPAVLTSGRRWRSICVSGLRRCVCLERSSWSKTRHGRLGIATSI